MPPPTVICEVEAGAALGLCSASALQPRACSMMVSRSLLWRIRTCSPGRLSTNARAPLLPQPHKQPGGWMLSLMTVVPPPTGTRYGRRADAGRIVDPDGLGPE